MPSAEHSKRAQERAERAGAYLSTAEDTDAGRSEAERQVYATMALAEAVLSVGQRIAALTRRPPAA